MIRTQPKRAVILIIYIGLLFLFNYLAFSSWLPEKDCKGLWFYTGIASVLLGNLLVTPFYTKPVDSISYSVVSLIAVFLVNMWTNWGSMDRIIFISAISFLFIVLASSFISILTKDTINSISQRISRSCLIISEFLGNQRVVFSVVILFALIVFHRNAVRESFFITIAWVVVVILEPDKHILSIYNRIRTIWHIREKVEYIGLVYAYQTPNMILIKQEEGSFTNFGTIVIYKDYHASIKTGITLNYVGKDEELLLRAIDFELPPAIKKTVISDNSHINSSFVTVLDFFEKDQDEKNKVPIITNLSNLIGIVDIQTNVEMLKFEVFNNKELETGSIVEVDINGKSVIYQVIDGLTEEEKVFQKNKYGFAKAEAMKIGIWVSALNKFTPINWIPELNTPVFLIKREDYHPDINAIGHFPNTNFNVGIKDINELVTHNTAILGILGIGKSMLSVEIVERLISNNIKVICIDLTNQYSNLLIDFYDSENEENNLRNLYELGAQGRSIFSKNVEEGGSINNLHQAIIEDLRSFIVREEDKFLKIYNPAKFKAWRQDSKPYKEEASMASLTPTEITQLISESALEICHEIGMTDNARVCLVYEEAHSLVPEWNSVACEGDKIATNGTARAILQGRKYGLGCILITQRTANVTKTILNQCNSIFAMRTFDDTGKAFIANYIGSEYAEKLSTLKERQAVFYGKASTCENPVLLRLNDRNDFVKIYRATNPPHKPKPKKTIETKPVDLADDLPF